MSYSQNDEELYILDYFADKQTGKFVDIGAFHVTQLSNVRALYEKGFSGVLVEPAPSNYQAIADHYKDEPKIKVLNVAIGEENGEIDFYESNGDAVSTSNMAHMKKWGDAGVKYSPIKVQQVSVVDFMNEHCRDADFLSIDTEATNIQLFRMIPNWVFGQISMLCIEHDANFLEIEEKCYKYGMTQIYLNGENIIMARL
jgi:FkbM family methyltransferase